MNLFLKKILKTTSISLLLVVFYSCKTTYNTQLFNIKNHPTKPDYNRESSWAMLPNKYTKEFKKYATKRPEELQADVFYVYPTLNVERKDNRWNVPITDAKQNKKVTKALLFQASAFANSGRIFTPLYRQAHYRVFEKGFKKTGVKALQLAYSDIKKAFEVYLEKYNNNRPIIIASHSQGSIHTIQLLKDFFDEKPLQKKLIAAYLVGMKVKPNEFKSIKPMISPDETSGFVSWNTYKKGHFPIYKDWYKGGVTTNPITWDHQKKTKLHQHKGFLYSNGKIYEQALKVEITDGLVWSTNPKFPYRFFMSFLRNYHVGDINLFWKDIQENVDLRTNKWLQNR